MKKAMIFTAACLVVGVAGLAVSLPMAAQDALDIYNDAAASAENPYSQLDLPAGVTSLRLVNRDKQGRIYVEVRQSADNQIHLYTYENRLTGSYDAQVSTEGQSAQIDLSEKEPERQLVTLSRAGLVELLRSEMEFDGSLILEVPTDVTITNSGTDGVHFGVMGGVEFVNADIIRDYGYVPSDNETWKQRYEEAQGNLLDLQDIVGNLQEENLLRRMHYFGTKGIVHEIKGIQYLTDLDGMGLREQIITYMEQKYGIEYARNLAGMTGEWEEVEIQEKEAKENQNQSIEEMKQMSEEMEKDHQEEIENPFDCMEQIEANGIISYVLPKDKRLSGKEINRDRQVSVRIRVAGRGNFPARKNLSGTEKRLLFNEYVLKNLENAAGREAEPDELEDQAAVSDGNKIYQEERKKSLDYEVEYLLAGKKSDKENLESVLMKLFLIRMGVNYICLQKDSGRKAEAEVLAVTICTLLLMPEGTEVVKQLILAAWAGGESVADLRTLLAGQRVPAIKTSENWSVSLAELPLILSSDKRAEVKETEKGLSYKDYLRILLFLKDTKEVTMRLADRIEENIRSLPEKEYFRIDQCVTKLEIENKVTVYGDISYTFPAYFGYQ